MKLSDYVIDSLAEQGITHIFEVCGGALAHLLDSLYGRTDITTVSMHHEMAAAIAAEGYARVSGKFGVAMATSGPGATNLITGIGSCFFDSIPCLYITGQVNTYEYKFDRPVRQIGFQETDIVSIVKPIVKKGVLVQDADGIRSTLEELYSLMVDGRPGPVLLDIPLNIQRAAIDPPSLKGYSRGSPKGNPSEDTLDQICSSIKASTRPVILAGGGVRSSHATEDLIRFAHVTGIPVVTSLMGLDAFPHEDSLFIGMIGTYGNRYANLAIANADLVIALGTRFDTRQTGTRPETFARKATIVHVDIDPLELNSKIREHFSVQADVRQFLELITVHPDISKIPTPYIPWLEKINQYKRSYPDFKEPATSAIDPNYFLHLLSEDLMDDAIVCVDVGQIQMWAAQSLVIRGAQRFLTEGGMASIGSALPMAIGAAFAGPKRQIIVITGDGGFQLNIQELQTVYHHHLPIKIILLNNNGYGMIKQFQEQYLDSKFQSSGIGYSNPDFLDVVRAYKIPSMQISSNDEIDHALRNSLSDMHPGFLEVRIDERSRALPKLAVNRPVEDQEPLLSREELRSKMLIEILPEPEKL
ncbi:thiamine pyrophosphate-binding protein [Methanosphaerula palustris]|uniref:Probable acetolactate synthase large subunit n=1 Tax=Methanosphaerula palustris (strain ATCC BAA-1556 / DSM 19958 / E1-9c) TaxID=521011 RepID=B8GDY4_METPE|nr:thiamine pyrophosphate-binding protein [Methanosphaerula palustris]ACL17485.1 thiamine pyrophosphate protein central region [Methanosphaerula palustris E1-9c]